MNGLMGAAIASGVGQGLANASAQGMQFLMTQSLQRERIAMEERRQQLMEQAATAREQRGYEFQRGMQQERQGFETVQKEQDRQARTAERVDDHAFQRGLQQEQIGSNLLARSQEHEFQSGEKALDRTQQTALHDDTMGLQREKMAQDDRQADRKFGLDAKQFDAQKAHWAAMEAHAKQQYGDNLSTTVQAKDGTVYAIMKSGQAKPIVDPEGHPLQLPKGFSDQDKTLAHALTEELKDARKAMSDPLTMPDDKARLQQEYAAKNRQLMSLLGQQQPEGSKPFNIAALDPFKNKPQPTPSTPDPAPERQDVIGPAMAGLKEKAGGLIQSAKDALLPKSEASVPQDDTRIRLESPEAAKQALSKPSMDTLQSEPPSRTQSLLNQKRDELKQRESSMKPSAQGTTSTVSPYDVLKQLPEKAQQSISAQISDAVRLLRDGSITEQEFKARIKTAWMAVPGEPVPWADQARSLADGLYASATDGGGS